MSLIVTLFKYLLRFLFDLFQTFVIALAIFVVIYQFAAQPHQVRGASMEPNFENREYILTNKISYRFGDPQRGDVIVFHFPQNPELDYIKRILALPNEQISLQDGKIFINGNPLPESYLPVGTKTSGHSALQEGERLTLGPVQYFVLGDNRSRSSDSREWGAVPRENIIGKAFFRYWPPSRIGLVDHAEY